MCPILETNGLETHSNWKVNLSQNHSQSSVDTFCILLWSHNYRKENRKRKENWSVQSTVKWETQKNFNVLQPSLIDSSWIQLFCPIKRMWYKIEKARMATSFTSCLEIIQIVSCWRCMFLIWNAKLEILRHVGYFCLKFQKFPEFVKIAACNLLKSAADKSTCVYFLLPLFQSYSLTLAIFL